MCATVVKRAAQRIGSWPQRANAATRKPNIVEIHPVIEAFGPASAEIEYVPAPGRARARRALADVAQVAANLLPVAVLRELAKRWACDVDDFLRRGPHA